MQPLDCPIDLIGQVDVPLSGAVTPMPHEGLKGIGRHRLRVHGRESPTKVMEAVHMTSGGMLMILSAGQVNPGRFLDLRKVSPKCGSVMRPGEHHRSNLDRAIYDLPKVIDHDRVEWHHVVTPPLVILMAGHGLTSVKRDVIPPQGQGFPNSPTGHVRKRDQGPPPIAGWVR